MSQTSSPTPKPIASVGSESVAPHRFALSYWLVSIVLHSAMLASFAMVTWTVAQQAPEREFKVGIMVRKDTDAGAQFETPDTTFVERTDMSTSETKFLPDIEPSHAVPAPKLPDIDLTAIGISGASLPGSTDVTSAPDGGIVAGAMASTTFFNAKVWGSKFVYIIDRSGSMSQRDRINVAKRELLGSLAALPPEAQFQIIFYNLNDATMSIGGSNRRLFYASDQNKVIASRFIESIVPEGGTNHLPALKSALAMQPDVIFFLTDADDLRDSEVKDVTALNRDRVRIHAIAFGIGPEVDGQYTLRDLADKNGGSYRYIDATRLGRGDQGEGR